MYPTSLPDLKDFSSSLTFQVREDLFSNVPERRVAALRQVEEQLPAEFDSDYVENVLVPAMATSILTGERLSLPMIDEALLSKEEALPFFLWGLLYDDWKPNFVEDGLSVFAQGYDNRGENNLRKRIYAAALTPDLYTTHYQAKTTAFFNRLLAPERENKPLMRQYLDIYFDLFWDLHVGISGDIIHPNIRQIGESFNTVLAYLNPTEKIVYENYMKVRELRPFLTNWIAARVEDVAQGQVRSPESTFVHYWLKNSGNDPNFRRKDIVFECFHNFVALSQWGNTIYNIMQRLSQNGDCTVKHWFEKTMSSDYNKRDHAAFTPLDRFVMELFRTISPNTGSISTIKETGSVPSPIDRYAYVVNPHQSTSFQPRHWDDPTQFNPDRYLQAPTSQEMDATKSKRIGFAQCPFHETDFAVQDGRDAQISNSIFGTVYGSVDGNQQSVCDYAGYAPFGFGYRRCPGELLTVELFKDFLVKVWRDKIEFMEIEGDGQPVPVGPATVVQDNIAFSR